MCAPQMILQLASHLRLSRTSPKLHITPTETLRTQYVRILSVQKKQRLGLDCYERRRAMKAVDFDPVIQIQPPTESHESRATLAVQKPRAGDDPHLAKHRPGFKALRIWRRRRDFARWAVQGGHHRKACE